MHSALTFVLILVLGDVIVSLDMEAELGGVLYPQQVDLIHDHPDQYQSSWVGSKTSRFYHDTPTASVPAALHPAVSTLEVALCLGSVRGRCD